MATANKTAAKKTADDENAVVPAAENAIAPAALFEDHAAEGFEQTTADDIVTPFIKLLQKMSDEVDEDHGSYIDGAKPGMFMDIATGELSQELEFIVCHYHRAIVEWRDRDSGGGFIAQHPIGYETELEREVADNGRWTGRWRTGVDTHAVDTRYFFGLRVRPDGSYVPGVLSFSSTQIKKARSWVTRMRSLTGTNAAGVRFALPIFAGMWKITSVSEENDQGSWRGYKVEPDGLIEDPNLASAAQAAREFFKSVAGTFQPVDERAATKDKDGEDLPF